MKNEHKIGTVVLMALSAIAAVLLTRHYFFASTDAPVGLPLYAVSEDTEADYAVMHLSYPVLGKEHQEFNKTVQTFVQEQKDAFLSTAEANWKARYETQLQGDNIPEKPTTKEKFPLFIAWSHEQLNERYVSIALEVYGFSGGAHGSTLMKTLNYDMQKKTFIRLADLFPENPNYLASLSEQAISQLRQQQSEVPSQGLPDLIAEGAGPKEENFEAFTFSDQMVTVYFQQYQVGPYAMGIPKITLPRHMQE
jgi:hypothetical protein